MNNLPLTNDYYNRVRDVAARLVNEDNETTTDAIYAAFGYVETPGAADEVTDAEVEFVRSIMPEKNIVVTIGAGPHTSHAYDSNDPLAASFNITISERPDGAFEVTLTGIRSGHRIAVHVTNGGRRYVEAITMATQAWYDADLGA